MMKRIIIAGIASVVGLFTSPAHANSKSDAEFMREWECATAGAFFEARSDGLVGAFGVVESLINRARSPHFPSTICSNLYMPYQYSFIDPEDPTLPPVNPNEIIDTVNPGPAWETIAYEIQPHVEAFLEGRPLPTNYTRGATHYHVLPNKPGGVSPSWASHPSMKFRVILKSHIYYHEER